MNSKLTKFALTATLGLAITFTLNACGGGDSIKDSRDGKTYKTVKIGEQVWMAENLNYAAKGSKCGGTDVQTQEVAETEETDSYTIEYYLVVEENTVNCDKYGRLYNWETAMKACPSGWHLPSKDEWQILVNLAGGEGAGKKLNATSGWNDYEVGWGDGMNKTSRNGEDAFGFSALPGGYGYSRSGVFQYVGSHGYWWSSTEESSSGGAYGWTSGVYGANEFSSNPESKSFFFSIRCIQN